MSSDMLKKRQRLAPLGIVTALSLLGFGLGFGFGFATLLIVGAFVLPLLILALVSLAIGGLVATGVRWMPLFGVVYCIATMISGLVTNPYVLYHLTHPGEVEAFITFLSTYVCGIIVIYAGIGATVQNYRSYCERRAPRWLATSLTGVAGFLLGALVVSLMVGSMPQAASEASTVNGMPAVHMGITSFVQTTVTISKGSKLVLIDDGQYPHILANGSWVNNTQQPATEAGAPAVSNATVNGGNLVIGPFNTAGTFHIFCTVHQGMNLTVIVQ
jgi:plastocyanin